MAGREALQRDLELHSRLGALGPLGPKDRVSYFLSFFFFFAPHHILVLPTGPGEKTMIVSVIVKGFKVSQASAMDEKTAHWRFATFKGFQNFY